MARQLFFRCPRCQGTTNVRVEFHDGKTAAVGCSVCRATYAFNPDVDRGKDDREYREKIRACARARNLDAASACSFLEGFLPAESPRGPKPAVIEVRAEAPSTNPATFVLTLLLILIAFMGGRQLGSHGAAGIPGSTAAPASASLAAVAGPALPMSRPAGRSGWIICEVDQLGTLTRLSGPDPRTVLEALLDQPVFAGNLAPYGLAPVDGAGTQSKLGVARDRMDPDQMVAVTLRADREGRWVAGDGSGPVRLEPIAATPEGFTAF